MASKRRRNGDSRELESIRVFKLERLSVVVACVAKNDAIRFYYEDWRTL